jgi:hypothetical protein
MIKQKPTDYDQPVHCCKCGDEIYGTVYVDRNGNFEAYCDTCAAEEIDEDEDAEFSSMERWEYLDECNDRAYGAYVDRCVDEQRDREVFG